MIILFHRRLGVHITSTVEQYKSTKVYSHIG